MIAVDKRLIEPTSTCFTPFQPSPYTTMSLKGDKSPVKKTRKRSNKLQASTPSGIIADGLNNTSDVGSPLVFQEGTVLSKSIQSHTELLVKLIRTHRTDAVKLVEAQRDDLTRQLVELQRDHNSLNYENERLRKELNDAKEREDDLRKLIESNQLKCTCRHFVRGLALS